jgi:cyanate lyase
MWESFIVQIAKNQPTIDVCVEDGVGDGVMSVLNIKVQIMYTSSESENKNVTLNKKNSQKPMRENFIVLIAKSQPTIDVCVEDGVGNGVMSVINTKVQVMHTPSQPENENVGLKKKNFQLSKWETFIVQIAKNQPNVTVCVEEGVGNGVMSVINIKV